MTSKEAACFLPVLLIFYAFEYNLISAQTDMTPWFAFGFAGFLGAIYLSARRMIAADLGSRSLIFACIAIVLFHAGYIKLLSNDAKPWLFAVLVLITTYMPRSEKTITVPVVTALCVLVIEYWKMFMGMADQSTVYANIPHLLGAATAGSAALWVRMITDKAVAARKTSDKIVMLATHLLAVATLYRATTEVGPIAVSASWLFYAVVTIAYAFQRQDRDMARSAIVVLIVAAGKALLVDASSAPTIVRILCLLLTGTVLYGCGYFLRQTAAWGAAKKEGKA
jgi:hypothetical protein